jgi:hypothetical protein
MGILKKKKRLDVLPKDFNGRKIPEKRFKDVMFCIFTGLPHHQRRQRAISGTN